MSTTTNIAKECPAMSLERRCQNWMVSIDDSACAFYAFQFACNNLLRDKDHLFLVNIVREGTLTLGDTLKSQRKFGKKILGFYMKEAERLGITCSLILGQYRHIGEALCLVAERLRINQLILGRRSMMDIKRLLVGSTSRYVVENANCNVAVVRQPIELKDEDCISNDMLTEMFNRLRVKASGVSSSVNDDISEFSFERMRSREGRFFLYIFRDSDKPLKRKEITIVSSSHHKREEPKEKKVEQREREMTKEKGGLFDVGEKRAFADVGEQEGVHKPLVE